MGGLKPPLSDLLGTGKRYIDRGLLCLDYRMGKLRQPSQGHTAGKKVLVQTGALLLGSDRQVPEAGRQSSLTLSGPQDGEQLCWKYHKSGFQPQTTFSPETRHRKECGSGRGPGLPQTAGGWFHPSITPLSFGLCMSLSCWKEPVPCFCVCRPLNRFPHTPYPQKIHLAQSPWRAG